MACLKSQQVVCEKGTTPRATGYSRGLNYLHYEVLYGKIIEQLRAAWLIQKTPIKAKINPWEKTNFPLIYELFVLECFIPLLLGTRLGQCSPLECSLHCPIPFLDAACSINSDKHQETVSQLDKSFDHPGPSIYALRPCLVFFSPTAVLLVTWLAVWSASNPIGLCLFVSLPSHLSPRTSSYDVLPCHRPKNQWSKVTVD